MPENTTIHTVKIVYKSGAVQEMDVYEFSVEAKGATISSLEWKAAGDVRPIFIGVDNIESVWVIGKREV